MKHCYYCGLTPEKIDTIMAAQPPGSCYDVRWICQKLPINSSHVWVADAKAFHFLSRLTSTNYEGKHAFGFGFRFGYWPCLRGPFVQLALGKRIVSIWYGTQWKGGALP